MRVILNPSPMDKYLKSIDLSGVYMLILNEIEGAELTSKTKIKDILAEMKRRYPATRVVLTLGKDGGIYQDEAECYIQRAYQIQAVDTTGAGDTFTGFFIRTYFQDMNAQKALEIASKAAAIAVTVKGAVNSIPSWKELNEYLFD